MKNVMLAVSVMLYAIAGYAQPAVAVADGYAEGTTGGAGGQIKVVSSASAFKSACESSEKLIIVVEGDLGKVGLIQPESNKTIIGKDTNAGYDGNLSLSGVSNIIIQNLNITNTGGVGTNDGVEASSECSKIFVTKCTFTDCPDGSYDIKRGSDFVTVSWCRFKYPNRSSHTFPNLIGHSDGNGGQDRGKLHVTLHHNWYDIGCRSRMPRVRFGTVHVYNNYYNCENNNYCIGTGVECNIRVENCLFENVNRAWGDMNGMSNGGEIGWDNIKFIDTELPTYAPNSWPVFELSYSFSMNNVDDIKSIVTDPEKGAGNVMGSVSTSAFRFGRNPQTLNWMAEYDGSSKVTIYGVTGRRISAVQSSNMESLIQNNCLPAGSYFVKPPVSNSGTTQHLTIK